MFILPIYPMYRQRNIETTEFFTPDEYDSASPIEEANAVFAKKLKSYKVFFNCIVELNMNAH